MNTFSQVLIRFDAGPEVGLGHWYRCVALAEELIRRGQNVCLLVNPLEPALATELHLKRISFVESLRWDTTEVMSVFLADKKKGILILDTMDTKADYVQELSRQTLIITIGGSGEGRDYAPVRIDGMIPRPGYADGFRGQQLYVGPEYLILRDIFRKVPQIRIREQMARVLVALGGDAHGVGGKLAEIIVNLFPEFYVDVLLGPLAKRAKEETHSRISFHHNVDNPRYLLEAADVVMVSGGMTTYEAMRMGIPVLVAPQVPLQEITSKAFVDYGVGLVISRREQKMDDDLRVAIRNSLLRLADVSLRRNCAEKGRNLVDGNGLCRVADIVTSCRRAVN